MAQVPVAIINNSQTPYRLAYHLRLARELPQIQIWSLFTHGQSNADWRIDNPPEIRPVEFGIGESSNKQGRLAGMWHEYRKGGRIIAWLKEHKIQAIVLGGYNDSGRLRIMRWCNRHGIPVMLFGDSNIRDDNAAGWKRTIKSRLLKRILKKVDICLPCGSLGRAYFERYGFPGDRIFYTPYEPDYDLIQNLPVAMIENARSRFNLSPTRRRIVYSGRLVEIKQVDHLINAFVRIASHRPDWNLVIVGSGPLDQQLRDSVPSELRDRVIWTGFLDDQPTISAIYRASDVLVLPSLREPWALVINEAAAAGMAILCSDVVGAGAELVRDHINGFTFPANDDGHVLYERLLEVTQPGAIDSYKSHSREMLAEWRQRGDPVNGLRQALESLGLLPIQQ